MFICALCVSHGTRDVTFLHRVPRQDNICLLEREPIRKQKPRANLSYNKEKPRGNPQKRNKTKGGPYKKTAVAKTNQ